MLSWCITPFLVLATVELFERAGTEGFWTHTELTGGNVKPDSSVSCVSAAGAPAGALELVACV